MGRWEASSSVKITDLLSTLWIAPSYGLLKWNVDTSFNLRLGRSAISGVLRDHRGNLMCLFSSPIPSMETNSAEVLTIHRAISISCANKSLIPSSLLIESDSTHAVAWCTEAHGGPWNLGFQLNFIRSTGSLGLNVKIVHKSRSSNQVVDALAKQGLICSDNFVAWIYSSLIFSSCISSLLLLLWLVSGWFHRNVFISFLDLVLLSLFCFLM